MIASLDIIATILFKNNNALYLLLYFLIKDINNKRNKSEIKSIVDYSKQKLKLKFKFIYETNHYLSNKV